MELYVGKRQKKEVAKAVIQNSSRLCKLKALFWVIVIVTIVGCSCYAVLNFVIPELNVVRVRGELIKDVYSIIKNTVLFLVLGIFGAAIVAALIYNFASIDSFEREEEQLYVFENGIKYVFRTKNRSDILARINMWIPYENITTWSFDEKTKKISLRGEIECTYIEDYRNPRIEEDGKSILKEFDIYDYFNPSLRVVLNDYIKEN